MTATAEPDSVRLSGPEGEHERQMAIARRVMKDNFAVLRELAK